MAEKNTQTSDSTDEYQPDVAPVSDSSHQDFLEWANKTLQTLETAYAGLAKNPAEGREFALKIQEVAFACRTHASVSGFELGSAIAKSLYDFLERDYVEGDTNHVLIIRKHIDTLSTIFHHNIAGDGGTLGLAVHSALGKLITKFDVS